MTNIAIFVSGNGTNCENIIRYFSGSKDIRIVMVLSNRADAYTLVRDQKYNIPTLVVPKEDFKKEEVLMPILDKYSVDFIVLAGFLLMAPDFLIRAFDHRMINIHPALLPKYGGKGMYGHHVHEAVIAAGEKESGITIHLVNEHYDSGRILFQAKCQISYGETPDDLAAKLHLLEQANFPQVIENYCQENSYQL